MRDSLICSRCLGNIFQKEETNSDIENTAERGQGRKAVRRTEIRTLEPTDMQFFSESRAPSAGIGNYKCIGNYMEGMCLNTT